MNKLTALTVVKPLTLTPAMLVSTDVPETDHAEWAIGTTYAEGDRVIVASTHSVYQSVIDSNTGNAPASEPTKWARVGPTNRWKAFDASVSSQTAQATSMAYRFTPGMAVSSFGALNLTGGTSMRLRLIDPTYGTVYDKTINLSRVPLSPGWWAWFFGERRAPSQALFNDLPSFPNADLLIDLQGGPDLAVGVLLCGQQRQFALGVRAGVRLGIQDYSRKEKTEFGDTVLVERAFAKRATLQLVLSSSEVDSLNSFLAEVRATPCLWIASNRYESTTIYGFYKSFDIVLSYFDYSDCDLDLEGLT